MGNGSSIPPGEPLYIQEPACCSGFKFAFSFECSQPVSLSSVNANKWSEFQTAVHENAIKIKNNELLALGLIPFFLVAQVIREAFFLGFVGAILVIGASLYIIQQNQTHDNAIRDLCAKFSSENGIALLYHTEYTGCCKPKGAKTVRAVIIQTAGAPLGAVVGPAVAATTTMSVQVPPGAQSGQTLQIQTASGLMQVVVPQGVAEGQSFQVQVPPSQAQMVTVQATPVTVQATPATSTSEVTPAIDEENPNMEADPKAKPPPNGFFCPLHGRFPGQMACPKCNPPEVN